MTKTSVSIAVVVDRVAPAATTVAAIMAVITGVTARSVSVPAASVRRRRPSTSGRGAIIATSHRARALTALARTPSVPIRRVRRATGRSAARRAAMAAAALAVVAGVVGAQPR